MCCVAPRRWCGGAATSEQKSSSDLLFRRRNMVRLCSFDSRSDQQRRCMYRKPPPCWRPTESYHRSEMIAPKCFCRRLFILPFTSKIRLEAENAIVRYQLARDTGGHVRFTKRSPILHLALSLVSANVDALRIIRPDTLVRWHRDGFRHCWHWKSPSAGDRPRINADLHTLIRRTGVNNPLRGAPRVHGDLLKLGFEVAQSSVAKHMTKPPASCP
jgi:hypothetical protein